MWGLRLEHICLWKLRMCAGVVELVGDGVLSGSGRSRKKVAQIRDDRAALSLRLEQLMSRALSLGTALPVIPAWETSPGKLSLSKWK